MARIAFTAAILLTASSWSHDLRVMGGKNAKIGDDVTVFITYSHTEPVAEVVDAKQLENYLLISPSSSKLPLYKRKGASLHDTTVKLEEKGVYQALATTTVEIHTKIKGDDGKHRHVAGTKAQAKKTNPTATLVSAVKTQQFAKTLIVAGRPERGPEASGLPFDIVPLDKPTDWKVGTKLRFQVLFNDKPLPNATLTGSPLAFAKKKLESTKHDGDDDEVWSQSQKTNRSGIAEITVDEPGRWVFQAERVADAAPVDREQYDKENFVTSLTMEIGQ
jgi:uncharacterized GH25 family protein